MRGPTANHSQAALWSVRVSSFSSFFFIIFFLINQCFNVRHAFCKDGSHSFTPVSHLSSLSSFFIFDLHLPLWGRWSCRDLVVSPCQWPICLLSARFSYYSDSLPSQPWSSTIFMSATARICYVFLSSFSDIL